MTVEQTAGPIVLSSEWLDAPKARAIPGAFYDRENRAWVLADPTPRGAAVALRLFPTLAGSNPELVDLRDSMAQEIRPFDRAGEYDQPIAADRVRAALQAEGHELYEFQAIDLGYHKDVLDTHGASYLGWSRGLGKTLGACALIDELQCRQTLIVAPNTSKSAVWQPELERFCPWLEVVVLRNSKAQRDRDLGYVRQLIEAQLDFALVVHYEALNIIGLRKSNNRGWQEFGEWDLVVADEVHRIANGKTLMAKALKRIPTKRKLGLSGTIMANQAEDLYSQLNWLFPQLYKSKWRDFNDRFLDYIDSGYSRVCVGIKIEKLEELREELSVFMSVRTAEDELDLPPKTHQDMVVELSPQQRKIYDELVETCFAQLPGGEVVKATDGLALLTRLRQVASGLDLLGDVADSTKLDLATDLIADGGVPTIAFVWYKAAGRALEDRLSARGIECFRIDGEVPHQVRGEYIKRFQDGERQAIVATLATLAESVTLHRASQVIRIDRAWSPSQNLQAEDRAMRIGQLNPVTVVDIIAANSVDELRVSPVIRDKEALRRLVLGLK